MNYRIKSELFLVLAILGMYIFTSPGASGTAGWNMGDTLTLIASVSYAFNIIYLDRYSREHNPALLTGLQFAVMAVLGWFYAVFFEETFVRLTPGFMFSLFYLTIFGSIAAISLMNRYQKGTTPVRAVIIYALEPVLAVGSGFIFLGDKIGASGITGGSIIIGGVLLSELAGFYLSRKQTYY